MQMGPSGSARPDVYTLPKSFSRFTPLSYEIKISVADFRRDVTTGKWQKYLEFSAGVIFAVPAGLIKKEDVPPGCGLIVRHEGMWRAAKGPTLKHVPTLQRDAWMKLLIDGVDRQYREVQPRSASAWHAQQNIRKKYGDKIANMLGDVQHAESNLFHLQEQLKAEAVGVSKIIETRRTQAQEQYKQDLEAAKQAVKSVCEIIGIEETNQYQIRDRVRELRDRMNENNEIAHLRRNLKAAQQALTQGLSFPLDGGNNFQIDDQLL